MFFPKESKIFESMEEQSNTLFEVAQTFQQIMRDWRKLNEGCAILEKLEARADDHVHAITDEIEKTFILPMDKEDITHLTESLDDIVDALEEAANRLKIYNISKSNATLRDFSDLILQATQQIHTGILMIKQHKLASKEFALCSQTIEELENRGDKLHRNVLELMMSGGMKDMGSKDAISIIKWKEIFQILEDTLDKCEDIAVLFYKLRMKYR